MLSYVLILIASIFLLMYHQSVMSSSIAGFWEADAEFLQSAGIDSMILYIAPFESCLSSRTGSYLLMMVNKEVVVNHPSSICISSQWQSKLSFGLSPKYYSVTFEEAPENIPQTLTMKIDPRICKMVLRDNDTIYAILYRNGYQSENAYL